MYFKKSYSVINGQKKWFPRVCVVGKAINTQQLAKEIAKYCTATPSDVHAVIRALPDVMKFFMDSGHSIHLDGLGSFHYKFSCAGNGVDTPEEVSPEQIKSVRVQFLPECQRTTGGKMDRALVGTSEFVEIPTNYTEE